MLKVLKKVCRQYFSYVFFPILYLQMGSNVAQDDTRTSRLGEETN